MEEIHRSDKECVIVHFGDHRFFVVTLLETEVTLSIVDHENTTQ